MIQDLQADARITAEEVNYLLEGIRHAFPLLANHARRRTLYLVGIRPVVGTGSLGSLQGKTRAQYLG